MVEQRDDRLVLRPDRVAATAWAGAGALLVAMTYWLVIDSAGHPLAWVVLAVALAVAGWFTLQAVVPDYFTVICDRWSCRGRVLWYRLEVPWEAIHLARIRTAAGEPLLQLVIRHGGEQRHPVALLLPVGADLDALHAALGARLGGPTDNVVHP